MTTSSFDLRLPRPFDLVAEGDARAAIDEAERIVLDLERDAAVAVAAADVAEHEAAEAGCDVEGWPWAIVRLQRFLDGLRDEVERDVSMLFDTTRAQARARIDDARAEADAIRAARRRPAAVPVVGEDRAAPQGTSSCAPAVDERFVSAPLPPPADAAATPPSASAVTLVPMTPIVEAPPTNGAHVSNSEAEVPAPVAGPKMEIPPERATPNDVAAAASLAALVPAEELSALQDAALEPVPPPLPVAPVEFGPLPGRETTSADTLVGDAIVPSAESVALAPVVSEPKPRRRRFRALPISALLELLAVVLVLVFILMRLG